MEIDTKESKTTPSLQNQSPRILPNQPGQTARSVGATCSAWDGVTAGASPAALTNLLPGGVKVAQMPVKHPVLVRVQVRQPFSHASVAQLPERGSSKSIDAGESPAGSTISVG